MMLLNPHRFGDIYFSSVVALLHFDGANGSTTFTDQKGHVFTAAGNAQISTTSPKYGTGCGLFDGSGDYLSTPDSADWDFAGGDFTVEFFVNFTAVPGAGQFVTFLGQRVLSSSDHAWSVQLSGSSGLQFSYTTDGITNISTTFSWSPTTGTYYHVALSRNSSSLRAFVDGAQVGATYSIGSSTIFNSASNLLIAAINSVPAAFLNGRLDDLRITKGVGRYRADFVPPQSPFPNI